MLYNFRDLLAIFIVNTPNDKELNMSIYKHAYANIVYQIVLYHAKSDGYIMRSEDIVVAYNAAYNRF